MTVNPRRLSDEQLASAEFRVTDPMATPGLTLEVPHPDLTPEIVAQYDVTPPGGRPANPAGPWIWCCHCQQAKHWKGFVVTNATERRFLIGSQCGPLYYGFSFHGARRQFQEIVERKGLLTRLHRIHAASEAMLNTVDRNLHSDGLRMIDLKRQEIEKASGNAFHRLSTSVQNGNPLTESVRVRDFEAERRLDEQSSTAREQPLFTFENRSLGSPEGVAVLRVNGDCRERLFTLKTLLRTIDSIARQATDALSKADLVKAVRGCEAAISAAQEAIEEARRAPTFWSASNLGRLSRWSVQYSDFDLLDEEGSLRVVNAKGSSTTIEPVTSVEVEDLPGI